MDTQNIKNAKSLVTKTHKNAWNHLRAEWSNIAETGETTKDFDWHFAGDKLKFRYIKKMLHSEMDYERLIDAFENKKEYNWRRYATTSRGRDYSISTHVDEEGNFRAWFSSEYPNCGNGDYYLLLSPKVAVFYEHD